MDGGDRVDGSPFKRDLTPQLHLGLAKAQQFVNLARYLLSLCLIVKT
jgi:hypothetical protein